jgi:cardiolipin synthase
MYRTACVLDIEKDFQETLEKSQLVTDETVKQTGIFYVVVGAVLKVLAPLM